MNDDDDKLIAALRTLPAPTPRRGFVDAALAKAVAPQGAPRRVFVRPETWLAASLGAALAASVTWFIMRPASPVPGQDDNIAFAVNESRNIEVLVESERDLEGATIRVTLTGGVILDGFENEHQLDWQADLKRGANLLSLPVTARSPGTGRLVAVIEHGGKARTVMIDLTVNDRGKS